MMGKFFCLSFSCGKTKGRKALAAATKSEGVIEIVSLNGDVQTKNGDFIVGPISESKVVVCSQPCTQAAAKGDGGSGQSAAKVESEEGANAGFPSVGCHKDQLKGGHLACHACHEEAAGSEVAESESAKLSCENSLRPGRDGDLSPARCDYVQVMPFSEDHGSSDEMRRENIFHYSPDKAIFSIQCERFGWDEEILPGHLSDPGVYQRENLQLVSGSPALLHNGPDVHSQGFGGPMNPDSLSPGASKSATSVDAVDNVSVGTTGGPCSEPTYHDREVAESSNGVHFGRRSSIGQEASAECLPLLDEQLKDATGHSPPREEELAMNEQKGDGEAHGVGGAKVGIFTVVALGHHSSTSTLSRVEEWIKTIQEPDKQGYEEVPEVVSESNNEGSYGLPDMDRELASAAVRGLNPYSTAAHIAGIGLQEVPSMGVFNCLKTLNLSANHIARVQAGSLPQSLHTLDLSKNRISQIEGFRDLTRLRVLNLSHNRITRIGHGLANCSLIKELYLSGNKIAEVEGLHRLLKLSVLDLSYNKLATSKALGQLAANYSSLLALNLLGNPILMNVGEDQLRKLVTSLTPHVTYFNKHPIKAVSVREAVVDNVAKAALGSSQRNTKSGNHRSLRKVAGVQSSASAQKKLPSRRSRDSEKRSASSSARPSKQIHHHHHSHHTRDGNVLKYSEKSLGKEHEHLSGSGHLLGNLALDSGGQAMHRNWRSDGDFQEG